MKPVNKADLDTFLHHWWNGTPGRRGCFRAKCRRQRTREGVFGLGLHTVVLMGCSGCKDVLRVQVGPDGPPYIVSARVVTPVQADVEHRDAYMSGRVIR